MGGGSPSGPRRARPRRRLVDALEPGGHRPDLGLDVAAGAQDRVAHQDRRAAGRRLLVVGHDRGVAHDDGDPVERRAELVGGDLGEDRPRALAHVGRAGVDDGAAVGEQPDGRVRQAGRRAGLEPDRDAPARARPDGVSPSRSSRPARRTACAQSPSAGVSPGMNASPGLARLRRRSSSGSMPSARAASFMFDSTAQICWGLPKPAERRSTARCATGRSGRRCGRRHHVRPVPTCSCPWPTVRSAMSAYAPIR